MHEPSSEWYASLLVWLALVACACEPTRAEEGGGGPEPAMPELLLDMYVSAETDDAGTQSRPATVVWVLYSPAGAEKCQVCQAILTLPLDEVSVLLVVDGHALASVQLSRAEWRQAGAENSLTGRFPAALSGKEDVLVTLADSRLRPLGVASDTFSWTNLLVGVDLEAASRGQLSLQSAALHCKMMASGQW